MRTVRLSITYFLVFSLTLQLSGQNLESLRAFLSDVDYSDSIAIQNQFFKSIKNTDSNKQAEIYLIWGEFLNKNRRYDSAESLFIKSIALYEPLDDKQNMAKAKILLAKFYTNADRIAQSLQLSHEAYDIYTELQDSINIYASLKVIAINHDYIGDHDIAISYYNDLAKIATDIGSQIGVASVYHNLGGVYSDEGEYDKALKYYDKSKQITEALDDIDLLTSIYQGFYLTYKKMELQSEAYFNLKKQYHYALKSGISLSIAFAYQDHGSYFLQSGNYDSSIYYSSKALELALALNKAQIVTNSYEGLRKAHYESGNYKKAYDFYQEEVAMNDSLYTIENSQLITSIRTQFETEKKERALVEKNLELQAADYSLKKQETYLLLLIFFLLFIIVVSVLIYRGYALRKKANSILRLKNKEIKSQNKQIKTLDEMKSKWFINVAHELRTPLTLIRGPVQKILNSENLTAQVEEDLTLVYNNTQGLVKLINEILDLSKLEEGEMILNMDVVNFNTFMKQIISIFQQRSAQEKVGLVWVEMDDPYVKIDRDKVSKIFVNLISNAIRFSDPGSSIKIFAEVEGTIKFSVSDSGAGIDPKDIPHVFNRFFQASSLKNAGGTGVGLALAKEIAELHGGNMSVISELSIGSTFILNLPISLKASKPISENESSELESALEDNFVSTNILSRLSEKPLLLVVEDNADMRKYIASLMKPYFEIKEAANGLEGLDLLKAHQVNMIISDMMMPMMDGLTFSRKVKDNKEWDMIPFVYLSALTEDNKMKEALRVGVDDFLHKPFDPEELIIRIQNLYQNAISRMEVAPEEDDLISHEDKILKKMHREVLENISDHNFSVMRLADCAAMSERQIYRYLKNITGLTPLQFIQEIKLNKAMELAQKRVFMSSSELASAVGFQHSPYFSSLFEKRFGKKPSAYLKVD